MSSSFPLLNLPSEAITHVLKSMDYREFITLSFLSKRAKFYVESMNLRHRNLAALIGNQYVGICMFIGNKHMMWNFSLRNIPVEQTNISLSLLDKVDLTKFGGTLAEWSMEGLCIREWYTHFKTIFGLSTYTIVHFEDNASMFEIGEVRSTFEPFDKLAITRHPGLDDYFESILTNFQSKYILFYNGSIDNLKEPQQILIQNYDDLEIYSDMVVPVALTMDDLLVTNSKRIDVGVINLTDKEINRFLKHWVRGSNPRMELLYIFLHSREAPNQNVVLKGITYMEVPQNHVRTFKTCRGTTKQVKGGFDVYRKDGTRATIRIGRLGWHWISMDVWHPHCVGDAE